MCSWYQTVKVEPIFQRICLKSKLILFILFAYPRNSFSFNAPFWLQKLHIKLLLSLTFILTETVFRFSFKFYVTFVIPGLDNQLDNLIQYKLQGRRTYVLHVSSDKTFPMFNCDLPLSAKKLFHVGHVFFRA